MGGFPPGAYIHHSAGPKSQRFFLRKRRPRFLIHARRGRKKPRFFFAGRFLPPGRAHRPAARNRRRAHFPTLLCESPAGGTLLHFALAKSAGGSVCPAAGPRCAREGVVGSLGVPGGDRAPLTREFPTNSGVGVSAPKGIKKTVPKDGEGDDGMRLLSDVGLVAAGGLIWNPHNDQPLIQRGKQIQFAEVIPRF